MVARLPKSEDQAMTTPRFFGCAEAGFRFSPWKQMGLLSPPEQPIAGQHAAGCADPLLFLGVVL